MTNKNLATVLQSVNRDCMLSFIPYLKTYVNAYGFTESIQKGFVKVLLGEVSSQAIHPVSLKGFFECEA